MGSTCFSHGSFPRSEEPEFVEWGYGGMGSVKTAASVGADNKWSRVTGSSAIGSGAGGSWQKDSRGRAAPAADPDDDGSGMAWLKKRREQREREKKEAEAAKPAAEAAEKENRDEQPHAEAVDAKAQAVEEPAQVEEPKAAEPEHVTTAITLPAHHRPTHHHSRSMERVPSAASYTIRAPPERRDSEDTARAASPPMSKAHLADVEQIVGELDGEVESVIRARRESQSSTTSTGSSSVGTEDEDADVEDSPKDSDREEDDDESEDDVSNSGSTGKIVGILTIYSSRRRTGVPPSARVWKRSAGTRKSRTRRTESWPAKATTTARACGLRAGATIHHISLSCISRYAGVEIKSTQSASVCGSTSLQQPGSAHADRRITAASLAFVRGGGGVQASRSAPAHLREVLIDISPFNPAFPPFLVPVSIHP